MPYQNYNMKYVAPQSLEAVDKTLSGLQQKHENTIERASALKATIASLDLNEAESEYRDSIIQGIDDVLNSRDIDGFKGYAFNDVLKLSGDLASDKGLLGRLNAQKEYKAFTEAVDKSTEFGQDVKDWSKANNQYYYDEASGGKWNPTVTPTKQIDLNTVAQMALKYIVPQTGTYNQVRYYDVNGNVTTTFDPKGTIDVFDTTSGTWERVTERQVRDGLATVIQQSPEVRASLEQDYEVAKWKDNKAKGSENYTANPMLYNGDGTTKSLSEYTEDIFAPFIRSQVRYTSNIKTTPNTGLLKLIGEYNKNKGNGTDNTNDFNKFLETKGIPGVKHEYINKELQETQSRIDNKNAEFRTIISKMPEFANIKLDYGKIDYTKPDETEKYLKEVQKNNPKLTNGVIDYLMTHIRDEYTDSYADIKDLNDLRQKDPKAASKAILYAKMTNGADLSIDNGDINEGNLKAYGTIIDNVFYNGNFIGCFENNNEYNRAIEELKNRGYGDLIIKGQLNDGKYYIGLNKENRRLVIPVLEAINNNATKPIFGWNNNGKFDKYSLYAPAPGVTTFGTRNKVSDDIDKLYKFYNKLNEDSKIAEQTLVEETSVVDGATPQAAMARSMAGNSNLPSSEINKYLKIADTDKEITMRNLSSADVSELGMLLYKDNGWEEPNAKELKTKSREIKYNQAAYDISVSLVTTGDSGRIFTQVNFRKKDKNDAKEDFSILLTSEQMRRYNPAFAAAEDDPDFQMTSMLNRRKRVGKSTLIGFEKNNNDVTKYYTLKPAGGDTFNLMSGDDVLTTNIDNKAAKEFLTIFNIIRTTHSQIEKGIVSDEKINDFIDTAADSLQKLCDAYKINIFDKSYKDAVKDMLL